MDRSFDDDLDADECKDRCQAVGEVSEEVYEAFEEEEEGSHAEDGHGVGRPNDELVLADANDGRYRVDGEYDIGRCENDDDEGEGCGHSNAVFDREEVVAVVFVRDGVDLSEDSEQDVLRWIDVFVVRGDEFVCGVDEDCGEEVEDGFEYGDNADGEENENGAGDKCADDAE